MRDTWHALVEIGHHREGDRRGSGHEGELDEAGGNEERAGWGDKE
ncbi:hypothetical protein [Haloarcula quadrata]|nr:hypothetical protein [Haloarcula quadrata]